MTGCMLCLVSRHFGLCSKRLNVAAGQGLRAEERKAREVVAGCENMLAEMALIEAAERDGVQGADVRYSEAGQQPGKRGKGR